MGIAVVIVSVIPNGETIGAIIKAVFGASILRGPSRIEEEWKQIERKLNVNVGIAVRLSR